MIAVFIPLIFVFSIYGCVSDNFQRQVSPEQGVKGPIHADFKCRQKKTLHKILAKNSPLVLKAEICEALPEAGHEVAVVIDTSGSMEINDPLVDGQCGRFEAVKTLVKKVSDLSSGANSMAFTIIGFDTEARTILDRRETQDLKPQDLDPEKICIAQGATNYQAAFRLVKTQYDQGVGEKQVPLTLLFITDGMPTTSLDNPVPEGAAEVPAAVFDDAMQAILDLDERVPDLSIKAVYLEAQPLSAGQNLYASANLNLKRILSVNAKRQQDNQDIVTVKNVDGLIQAFNQFDTPKPKAGAKVIFEVRRGQRTQKVRQSSSPEALRQGKFLVTSKALIVTEEGAYEVKLYSDDKLLAKYQLKIKFSEEKTPQAPKL